MTAVGIEMDLRENKDKGRSEIPGGVNSQPNNGNNGFLS